MKETFKAFLLFLLISLAYSGDILLIQLNKNINFLFFTALYLISAYILIKYSLKKLRSCAFYKRIIIFKELSQHQKGKLIIS